MFYNIDNAFNILKMHLARFCEIKLQFLNPHFLS
jgi:hypothetical protein